MTEEEDLKLSHTALTVLRQRYLKKDETREIIETPVEMFHRVAKHVAEVEKKLASDVDITALEEEFFEMMVKFKFLPNSPTLMNAGTPLGQLSACFVLEIKDSLESIFEAVKRAAMIHQSGGGTGFSFSKLRPKDDVVRCTGGVASGPISFMEVFDKTTDVIKQGGKRRGANMGILNVHHPDIIDFILVKSDLNKLRNFNLSVGITDEFMNAVAKKTKYDLINPRNNQVVKQLEAEKVFDLLINMAWNTGDPGFIFLDTINRKNPTPALGQIESTNPCGDVPLLPGESCNLGSINISKFIKNDEIDWQDLSIVVKLAVRFLDDVIDASKFPFPDIEKMTKANRKIGLGIMGFADALYKLRIPYNSSVAVELARKLMQFVQQEARSASEELAESRGTFPNYEKSIYPEQGIKLRNATVTSIAPTGTISLIAGCSSGIEPVFALAYSRKIMDRVFHEINPVFEEICRQENIYSEELVQEIINQGSLQQLADIPDRVKKVFVTALDIEPEYHVRIQAAFQEFVDNSVSKTINFSKNATINDIRDAILLAHELGCKGITIYRYGSREDQVLSFGNAQATSVTSEKETCPNCHHEMELHHKCHACSNCGYSYCDL